MEVTEKITLDMLTKEGVSDFSTLKKNFTKELSVKTRQ